MTTWNREKEEKDLERFIRNQSKYFTEEAFRKMNKFYSLQHYTFKKEDGVYKLGVDDSSDVKVCEVLNDSVFPKNFELYRSIEKEDYKSIEKLRKKMSKYYNIKLKIVEIDENLKEYLNCLKPKYRGTGIWYTFCMISDMNSELEIGYNHNDWVTGIVNRIR